jgi:NAD(P)-dependent dehydrogenase (short-subunit alcohol dehydrogenase family)
MVRAFAAEGARVVIASRRLDSCTTLADEISAEFGVDALPMACNVSSRMRFPTRPRRPD